MGVIALILKEVIVLFKKAVGTKFQLTLFVAVLFLLFCIHLSAIAVVLLAASTGFIKRLKDR